MESALIQTIPSLAEIFSRAALRSSFNRSRLLVISHGLETEKVVSVKLCSLVVDKDVLAGFCLTLVGFFLAKAIFEARKNFKIKSTKELAEIILEEVPRRFNDKKHPATKTFQAIRIFINNELKELELLLDFTSKRLKIGGRACIISFHSLEDRMVKQFFRDHSRRDPRLSKLPNLEDDSSFKLISKVIKPCDEEMNINPRSRSAKLRVIERIK